MFKACFLLNRVWIEVLLILLILCTEPVFCSTVPTPAWAPPLPLSDCTFQRPSTQQLKWESHSIQGNESRRKVTESHTSYPPGSFKGRTKGLPPSFPINLYALPHTGSMATSVAHVTYLIWLWDCFLWGMCTFSGGGGVLSGQSPWQIKGGCWYLSRVSVIQGERLISEQWLRCLRWNWQALKVLIYSGWE